MASLAIITMFKDEESTIAEWIEHHKLEGVREFFLIDNGSSDESPLIAKEKGCKVIRHEERQSQEKYLDFYGSGSKNDQSRNHINSDWIMAIDIDEYVYARNGYKKITDYLKSLSPSIDGVRLTFKMFGSSDSVCQPASIISEYTKRSKDNVLLPPPQNWNYKTIYRNKKSDVPRAIYAHAPEPLGTTIFPVKKDPENPTYSYVSNGRQYCDRALRFKESEKYLNLNHYAIQSKEDFYFIRSRKGDVNIKSWEKNNLRDYDFFKQRDFRGEEDHELFKKRGEKWPENFFKPKSKIEKFRKPKKGKLKVFCYWNKGFQKMPKILQHICFHNKLICDENDMEFHFISDSNILNFLNIPSFFEKLQPNHKSDWIRWSIIYKFGGAWIDADIILLKNLIPLCTESNDYDLITNCEMTLTERERKFENGYPEQILRSKDYESILTEDKYFKLGCCFMIGKRKTNTMLKLKTLTEEKIINSIDESNTESQLNWPEIGPVALSQVFKKYSNFIKVMNNGREDPEGFNSLNWKVDKMKPPCSNNYPGHNKVQWRGDPSKMKQKADRIMKNQKCHAIPSWSIYRDNDIGLNICEYMLHDPESLFKYLIR